MERDFDTEGQTPQYYFPVSNKSNPHIFARVPHEKRSHWLKLWNPTNTPEDVSVYDAFNTLAYCFSFDYQSYHNYAFGRFSACEKAIDDLKLSLRAYGTMANKDTTDGAVKYQEACQDLRVSSGDLPETEHVFKFRKSPARFKLLSLYEQE